VRKFFIGVIAILATQLVLAHALPAQNREPGRKKKELPPSTEPFDPHDLASVWRFHGSQTLSIPMPPMTPWGQQMFDAAKPGLGPRGAPLGNDPMMVCDPMGLPRILFYYAVPEEIIQLPDRVVQIFDWYHTFRIIWTDGRDLPKDPDPRWNGYSVGKWVGDVFVVESNGFNDRTWVDFFGAPHSDEMHLEERYHRVDHDTIELTITIDDPKTYTKPWVSDTKLLKLTDPKEFTEDFCVPSDEQRYKELMREPAIGADKKK
jgi:hypothetical protein